jgi:hypothetical protein
VGEDDFELFQKPLAMKFRTDDRRVLEAGEEMPQMVELFLSRQGLPDWFVITKMPIRDLTGRPAGIMGTVPRYNQRRGLKSADPAIAKAVGRRVNEPQSLGLQRFHDGVILLEFTFWVNRLRVPTKGSEMGESSL